MSIIQSGITGFDAMLSAGGFYQGDSVLVEGPSGVGKTTFGLQFIVNGILRHGQAGLIILFEETPQEFRRSSRHFGWDLDDMEKSGKLAILHTAPEDLLAQLKDSSSELIRKIEEMGACRVLIDCINPFRFLKLPDRQLRQDLLNLIQGFRRQGVTLVWTKEYEEHEDLTDPMERHLADSVVFLTHELKDSMRRRRLLEIIKTRGQKHTSGKFFFEITDQGIGLLPHLTQVKPLVPKNKTASTGIARLDEMLGGGMPLGSTFLFTSDGLANLYPIFIAMCAAGLAAAEGVEITPSANTSFFDVQRFLLDHSYDISGLARSGQVRFVDYYRRDAPEELRPYILDESRDNLKNFRAVTAKKARQYAASKLRWRCLIDANAAVNRFGAGEFKAQHTARTTLLKAGGHLGVLFAVLEEMEESTAAFLRYTSSGIVSTWVEDGYQMIQVIKTPSGHISRPGVVEVVNERPFIKIR